VASEKVLNCASVKETRCSGENTYLKLDTKGKVNFVRRNTYWKLPGDRRRHSENYWTRIERFLTFECKQQCKIMRNKMRQQMTGQQGQKFPCHEGTEGGVDVSFYSFFNFGA
jgi:hypothetical protein